MLGKFHDAYLKRFPVPFDSMLNSRDVVAESIESKKVQVVNEKAMQYFEKTFICTGNCRLELEENDILMSHIDVNKEVIRLQELKEKKKKIEDNKNEQKQEL